MTEEKFKVSDHALIRYMERRMGLDFDKIREEILSIDLQLAATMCGDGKYPIGDGMRAVIQNKVVVTVINEGEQC